MQMSYIRIIAGLLMLIIPIGALYILDKKSIQTFSMAVGRMFVQLLVLCLMVWGVIHVNTVWLNLLWLVCLAFYAAFIIIKRLKIRVGQFMLPLAISNFVAVSVMGLYLLYAVLPVRDGMDARWFVPVVALLMGHIMTTQMRGFNTYLTALKADEQQYEFLRGNGLNHLKAVLPFLRRALQAIMAPTIANLSSMGLFMMPLLLVGILLGGHAPIDAFVLTLMLTLPAWLHL